MVPHSAPSMPISYLPPMEMVQLHFTLAYNVSSDFQQRPTLEATILPQTVYVLIQKLLYTAKLTQHLRLPPSIAKWFVALDEGGNAYIVSPYYRQRKTLQSSTDIRKDDTHFARHDYDTQPSFPRLAFKEERGIGHGESASSLIL